MRKVVEMGIGKVESVNKTFRRRKKEKMKTKTKMLAMVEIAIVLCSMLIMVLPVIAAEQNQEMQKVSASTITTASEDDYVLGIYGNANEDDTIDMRDLTYVKLIFFGKKPETELADAKYDGKINPLDFIQIKLIIVGKEKEITLIDTYKEAIVTVKKPIKRVVVAHRFVIEPLRAIKVSSDLIVGIETYITTDGYGDKIFFAEFQDKPGVGSNHGPDSEAILNLHPDVVFILPVSGADAAADVCEAAGITVLRFYSGVGYGEPESYSEEITKLGYIFDRKAKAGEFRDFYEGCLNPIIEKVEKIVEEDKPTVYYEGHAPYYLFGEPWAHVEYGGGKNIFDIPYGQVDPEAVMARNPDIIVKMAPGGGVTGYQLDPDDTTEVEKVREEIMSRPELQNVGAVKNKKIYVMSQYFGCGFGYSGARNFLQILYNAKWFHPELFEDLDPKAIHQEYLERFQGLDIDLDKKGVFVYPEPS